MRSLDTQEQAIVDKIMANPGLDRQEIFKSLGIEQAVGVRILKRPAVKYELESRKKEAAYASMISCRRVMEEEACIAFSDPAELFDVDGKMIPPRLLPERVRRAISIEVKEVMGPSGLGKHTEYKYTLLDKKASLEKISKHLGLYERDNLQKAVKIYFMSHGDEGAPEAEIVPEIEKKKPRMITSDKPVALTE